MLLFQNCVTMSESDGSEATAELEDLSATVLVDFKGTLSAFQVQHSSVRTRDTE